MGYPVNEDGALAYDHPATTPARLTDSAEEYAAPSEAAQQFALVIHDSFIRTTDFELSMNRIAMMFDAFAAQAVAAAMAEREKEISEAVEGLWAEGYAPGTLSATLAIINKTE